MSVNCNFNSLLNRCYFDYKALDRYTNPNHTQNFIFNFSIISFIFIENKCLSDEIWDLQRKKKKFGIRRIQTRVNHIKNNYGTHFTIYATGAVVRRSSFSVD